MAISSGNTKITDPNGNMEVGKQTGVAAASAPLWNRAYLGITADGSGSWINAGTGVVSSVPCTVVATPGYYPSPKTLFVGVGGPNATQELLTFPGAKIRFTGSLGRGGAGIVVANKGSVTGLNSQNGASIDGQGTQLDAITESWCGFANSALGMNQPSCPNMDVQGQQ